MITLTIWRSWPLDHHLAPDPPSLLRTDLPLASQHGTFGTTRQPTLSRRHCQPYHQPAQYLIHHHCLYVCGDNHNISCIIHVYYVGFVWINNLWRVFVCIIWGCPSQLRAETTKVWITFYRPANLVNNSNLQVKQAGRHKSKNLRRANGSREKQTQVWINPHWPSNLRPWAPPRPQASWCRQGTTITAHCC